MPSLMNVHSSCGDHSGALASSWLLWPLMCCSFNHEEAAAKWPLIWILPKEIVTQLPLSTWRHNGALQGWSTDQKEEVQYGLNHKGLYWSTRSQRNDFEILLSGNGCKLQQRLKAKGIALFYVCVWIVLTTLWKENIVAIMVHSPLGKEDRLTWLCVFFYLFYTLLLC